MNRVRSHMDEINMIGKLAELKEAHYKNTLLLHAMMDLLIEKKVLTSDELSARMAEIDHASLASLRSDRPMM